MRTNPKRTFGLCIALCLGLTWGCVKVDVSVLSPGHESGILRDTTPLNWISLDDLKKLQPIKSCNSSSLNDVGKELQQTVAWCWAASTRMVMEYQNNKVQPPKTTDSQCNIVMNVLRNLPRNTNCCEEQKSPDFINAPSECVQGGWPHWILKKYEFSYKMVNRALDWETLTGEICSVGPFISVIKWSGGGQHVFIVKGYHETKDKDFKPSSLVPSPPQFVEVYDPNLNDHVDMTLDEFVGHSPKEEYGYQRFSHTLDVVQIKPTAKDQP